MIVWHRHSCLCRRILLEEASTGRSAGATQAMLITLVLDPETL
jgi:hypothetical protein